MRPVPAGRQRGQCCTPYSRLQEEIDNVETIAVTANNTANNAMTAATIQAGNAAQSAQDAQNSADAAAASAAAVAGALDDKVDKLTTANLKAYTHNGSTQGEKAVVDGTTADTIPIRDANGYVQGATNTTGTRDNVLTNGTRVQNDLDNYASMLRTSGNQTFAGAKTSGTLQIFNSRPYIYQRIKDSNNWYKVYQYDNTNRRIIIMDVIWAHQSYNGYGVGRIVIPIIGSATTAKWLYRSGNASAFTADTIFVGLTNDGKTEIWVKGGYFVYTEIVRVIRGNVEDAISNTNNVYSGTAETIDLSNYSSYAYGSE